MWVEFPDAESEIVQNTCYNLENQNVRLSGKFIVIFNGKEKSEIGFIHEKDARYAFRRLKKRLNVSLMRSI